MSFCENKQRPKCKFCAFVQSTLWFKNKLKIGMKQVQTWPKCQLMGAALKKSAFYHTQSTIVALKTFSKSWFLALKNSTFSTISQNYILQKNYKRILDFLVQKQEIKIDMISECIASHCLYLNVTFFVFQLMVLQNTTGKSQKLTKRIKFLEAQEWAGKSNLNAKAQVDCQIPTSRFGLQKSVYRLKHPEFW